MGMHKIGKLKFGVSGKGLSFQFGDGEEHRLGGKKNAEDEQDFYSEDEELDTEAYDQDGSGDRYDDDYADDRDYDDRDGDYDDGYDDRYDDRYDDDYDDRDGDYDDGYDDRDDDRYDDDYDDRDDDGYEDDYDDGYDDRYDDDYDDRDDRYDDDYGNEYDDRYSDEDADYGDVYEETNPVLRFLSQYEWLQYLLLFLLPPLGIYLLWRYRRFDRPIRIAISAASAVWFIIALILIFSGLFSGAQDRPTTPDLQIITPEPSAEATFEPTETEETDVSATPMPGTEGVQIDSDTVYAPATGLYYHNTKDCTGIEEGTSVSKVTLAVAQSRGMNQCPVCYSGQQMCWATDGGTYYHYDENCSGMTGASEYTVSAAKEKGKTACPVCVSGSGAAGSSAVASTTTGTKFIGAATKDQSGITVWATNDGKYYHVNQTCSGMKNATSGTLLQALRAGKEACPTCCKSASKTVYATSGGTYYHSNASCSGMKNPSAISLAEALVLGKKQCPTCIGGKGTTSASTKAASSGTVYVYGTKDGQYYHTKATCSGMRNAGKYTLKSMVAAGRAACPKCCTGAKTTVYATKNGTYYHSYATCSGMSGAQPGTLSNALASGYKKCPKCWGSKTASTAKTTTSATGTATTSTSGTSVYYTENGTYYHSKKACSGMRNAQKGTLQQAIKLGKKACPYCCAAAKSKVYSTKTGKYYHTLSDCSGMKNPTRRTVQEAIALGQSACPKCMGTANKAVTDKVNKTIAKETDFSSLKIVSNYKSGTSGIKVYATATGKYYHTKSTCGGMTNASHITLEAAMNYGKSACPKCASSAKRTVYATRGGKYYHYSQSCAGSGAVKGTRARALAAGLSACPYCVTHTKSIKSSNTYKAGKSGIKVYASVNGKYYHVDRSCAGKGSSRITLETALNYGKKACPSCSSAANKTVWASPASKYYHSSKTCAGAGATKGSFAKALAVGLKECPVCIGGSESYEVSDIKYSASGDSKVYINLDSDTGLLYYHKNSKCTDGGMKKGTSVTLEFALNWGYRACPYCNPATSAS